jgi:hypothetical protein
VRAVSEELFDFVVPRERCWVVKTNLLSVIEDSIHFELFDLVGFEFDLFLLLAMVMVIVIMAVRFVISMVIERFIVVVVLSSLMALCVNGNSRFWVNQIM